MDIEIIDFHIHPFIHQEDRINAYPEVLSLTKEDVLCELEQAGISKFCGSVIKRNLADISVIKESNREALELREYYNNKYIPGIHVHPDFLEESIKEIDFAHENNINLIGELVPYSCGWEDYSCDKFSCLLDHIAKYNMVVSLHTMNLDQMEVMARNHRDINFVFAHPGEKGTVLKHIEIMKKLDNVYLDLSGTGILRYGVVKKLVGEVGAERILFGTDYPIGPPMAYVSGVLGEKISDGDKEMIFCKNAKRLLGIK